MNHRLPRKRPLALSLLVCLLAPGLALAQAGSPREEALEARVAELEKQVQLLLAQQQQTQQTVTEVQAVQAAMPAPKPDDGKPKIQTTPINTAGLPGTRFSYGGFIKLDAMVTDTTDGEIADGSVGRMFYLPSSIPVGGADEAQDTDMGAQFSRFWFSADSETEGGNKLKGYLEFDLFGGGSINGNEVATNTYGLSVRQAYVSFNNWLAGQTWSNFQDVASLPEAVDFIGPTEGSVFVRQAQVRYTKGAWSFSIENPETTITPYRNVGARISSDDNLMPDLTARWQKKGDWGHFSVAALAREFKYENPATGIDDSAFGGGISVAGRYNIGKNDDIRYMATYGRGIGRYLGLGVASDTMLDASGNLEPLDGYGGFAAWRHAFSPKFRTNVFYSFAEYDNDQALTGLGVTEGVRSFHVNFIYSPLPKVDVGAELIWAERALESGAEGELRRLHTHVKYSF
jgi:hypothetical protein